MSSTKEIVFVKGRRMIRVGIDLKYKAVLDRAYLEKARMISNLASMIDDHVKDKDISYLNSEDYARLSGRTAEIYKEADSQITGVAYTTIWENEPDKKIPKDHIVEEGRATLLYRL